MQVWTKHDDKWLYFLFQVPFNSNLIVQGACQSQGLCPEADIKYCWSPAGKAPWTACDQGWVGMGDEGGVYSADGWLPKGTWLPSNYKDTDHGG